MIRNYLPNRQDYTTLNTNVAQLVIDDDGRFTDPVVRCPQNGPGRRRAAAGAHAIAMSAYLRLEVAA